MNPEIIVVIKGGGDELLERVVNSLYAIVRKAAKAGRAVPSAKIYPEYGPGPIDIVLMPGGVMLLDPTGTKEE